MHFGSRYKNDIRTQWSEDKLYDKIKAKWDKQRMSWLKILHIVKRAQIIKIRVDAKKWKPALKLLLHMTHYGKTYIDHYVGNTNPNSKMLGV